MRQTTLNFLIRTSPENGRELLLAMKKRGFGVGRWNGTGGKLQEGETPESACIRETEEEIGIVLNPHLMDKVGVLTFHFSDKPEWDQICHVFMTTGWQGEPIETEEMRPKWFLMEDIPFREMWIDDPHWLPAVLSGKKVEATFTFGNNGSIIEHKEVRHV